MGKIAYGRRRTEKKTGTRNEMHVVEQSEFPVYEGIHEAVISEEDWNLAQEKRSKNNYRREKIHDPEMHIFCQEYWNVHVVEKECMATLQKQVGKIRKPDITTIARIQ